MRNTSSIPRTLQENVRASDRPRARPRRGAHDPLARFLIDHPHSLAFCDAFRVGVREAAIREAGVIIVAIVTITAVVAIGVI